MEPFRNTELRKQLKSLLFENSNNTVPYCKFYTFLLGMVVIGEQWDKIIVIELVMK